MKISYNWLRKYADFDTSPHDLSVLLTDCGLEVESLDRFETVAGNLQGVVVGEVISCEKHPDADRLSLTRVDIGSSDILPVVCGAPNVALGQKVLVATVGTTVQTPKGPLEIRKATIRGQVSEGMICAEDELGLGASHEGIMVLADDAIPGTPASEYLALYNDWVFEIGLTPNRIDAASHIGVVRDIVATLNNLHKTRAFTWALPDVDGFKPDNNDLPIPVVIEDPQSCNRYCGLTISGVQVKESPEWLRNYLLAIGQKPINNVVDVTNFVLHELGQPLHAFDVAEISGNKVVVKKSPRGTKFVTLDGEERVLTGDDLMIYNTEAPMCMAGILGGLEAGVTGKTTSVFLESAYFDPKTIRKSSTHHGIKTDASFRFERGVDPMMTLIAIKRAAMLIKELAGGQISSHIFDVHPVKPEPVVLQCYYANISNIAGKHIPPQSIRHILEDLDFSVIDETNDSLRLAVPPYRVDVTREADVAEEVLRIYGYNNVEIPAKLHASIVLTPQPDKASLQNTLSDVLVAKGFYEIMNNSLTKGSYYESFGFKPDHSVSILNPLSQDLNVLRQSLLFGGLETIAYNQNRRTSDLKLFEFGNIYQKQEKAVPDGKPLDAYHEHTVLGLFLCGRRYPETWMVADTKVSFFDLKSVANTVFDRFGISAGAIETKNLTDNPAYAYCQQLFLNGQLVATLGLIQQALVKKFDIRQDVYAAVIEWDTLVKATVNTRLLYREIPKFPEVRRDLALLIDEEVSFAMLETAAIKAAPAILRDVKLFDVYADKKLGDGKKSYAVSFTLQDDTKTLTDSEIDSAMEKIAKAYKHTLNANIR